MDNIKITHRIIKIIISFFIKIIANPEPFSIFTLTLENFYTKYHYHGNKDKRKA